MNHASQIAPSRDADLHPPFPLDRSLLADAIREFDHTMGTPPTQAAYGQMPPYLDELYRLHGPERFGGLPVRVHLSWVHFAHWSRCTARTRDALWDAVTVSHDLALGRFLGAHFEAALALVAVQAFGHARLHLEAAVAESHPWAERERDLLPVVPWLDQVRCPVESPPG